VNNTVSNLSKFTFNDEFFEKTTIWIEYMKINLLLPVTKSVQY